MLVVRGTKKFLDRVSPAAPDPEGSTTALGDWFATVLFWRPQVALFVNGRTLLPVLVPFAPASSVLDRFSASLGNVLNAHGVDPRFVDSELGEMHEHTLAKTNERSVVGTMNEFAFLAETHRAHEPDIELHALSMALAGTPCGALRRSTGFPDLELRAVVNELGFLTP